MTNSRPIIWKSTDRVPLRGTSEMVNTSITGEKPAVVAVATDISHHEHFMSSFRITLWSVVILGRTHHRISRLDGCQTRIGAIARDQAGGCGYYGDRLYSRSPTESIPIELLDLAETLNQMLARLEDSFRRLSDFSSDIAHELERRSAIC